MKKNNSRIVTLIHWLEANTLNNRGHSPRTLGTFPILSLEGCTLLIVHSLPGLLYLDLHIKFAYKLSLNSLEYLIFSKKT